MDTPSAIWFLGSIAGLLTTVAFVPQVLRTWQSRSAADLSMSMLVTFALGIVLWIVYGIMLKESPIVVTNVITLILSVALIVMKVRFQ